MVAMCGNICPQHVIDFSWSSITQVASRSGQCVCVWRGLSTLPCHLEGVWSAHACSESFKSQCVSAGPAAAVVVLRHSQLTRPSASLRYMSRLYVVCVCASLVLIITQTHSSHRSIRSVQLESITTTAFLIHSPKPQSVHHHRFGSQALRPLPLSYTQSLLEL